MHYSELPASPPLDAFVRCFWFLSGDDLGTIPQVIVPDGRLELVLHLAEPFEKSDSAGCFRRQDAALFSGQITSPIRLRPAGRTDIVGIRFRTAAAGAILRADLAELTDAVEPLSSIAGTLADKLLFAASRCNDPAQRVILLSKVLLENVVHSSENRAQVIVAELSRRHRAAISEIAAEQHISTRTLERLVLRATGLPASTLRRVIRFRTAFRMLDGATRSWSGVAAAAGYYDQAHLIRDFRRFAGAAPSDFFRSDPELARAILGNHSDH